MSSRLNACAWPPARLAELVSSISRLSGLPVRTVEIPAAAMTDAGGAEWIHDVCGALGLETDPIGMRGAELEDRLRSAAPAALHIEGLGWFGLLAVTGKRAQFLTLDYSRVRMPLAELCSSIRDTRIDPYRAEIERVVQESEIPPRRRARTRQCLLEERLASEIVATVWPFRATQSYCFQRQMRDAGLFRRLAAFAGAHTAEYVLWLLTWWILGRAALSGRLDWGWLAAWALLLLMLVPLRWMTTWSGGLLAIGVGGLLKQRLLAGALRIDPDRIRSEGAGQLLGRVMESENVESLALGGGLAALLAVVELLLAAVVLALGPGGFVEAGLLTVWTAMTILLGWRYAWRRSIWTECRLRLTHGLVENMTGHRTRLAQQPPAGWHLAEDQALEEYVQLSRGLDREGARLRALVPRGWMIVALAGLAPAFVGAQKSTAGLAVSLGGALLAQVALNRLVMGLSQLAGAAVSWKKVAPLFHAAAMRQEPGAFFAADRGRARIALDAQNIVLRHTGRAEPVLQKVNLRIFAGDHLLLEGQSGGGKSSLVSVLSGLRKQTSGSIMASGLDCQAMGERGWRRQVVAAPQYQENHLMAASLAFNLLMGRCWPPSTRDLAEAEALCRELGLGPLLDRMPAGIQQIVGDTGWQLSQGERGRVFLARALLQRAELVILDESFAALDPESLQQALACAYRRAETLLVVAHP